MCLFHDEDQRIYKIGFVGPDMIIDCEEFLEKLLCFLSALVQLFVGGSFQPTEENL